MEQVNVALLGLGVVGTGVWKMIEANQDMMVRRTGKRYQIQSILVRDLSKKRDTAGVEHLLTDSFADIWKQDIQIVIEVMGGIEPARTYIKQALQRGCHVITANKELIAQHGVELERLAAEHGVQLLYEASVGGGIPVIGTLQHLLKVNRIHKISGIVNGTTNYILTQMSRYHRDFADVLSEAQKKGYAEADPSADVEGKDAVYKLAILIRLVFQVHIPVSEIAAKGITDITPIELKLAEQLGYSIKLIAQAEQYGENGPISCSVYPTLLPLSHSLAKVHGVYNAIHIEGDQVQDLTLVGQGAGEKPTASAVVEDLCNLYRLPRCRSTSTYQPLVLAGAEEWMTKFIYVRANQHSTKEIKKEWQACFQQLGMELLTWTMEKESNGDVHLAFLVRGGESHIESLLPPQLQNEIKKVIVRPVLAAESQLNSLKETEEGSAVTTGVK